MACALAARHVGGAINFVAVAETLNIGGNAVAAESKSHRASKVEFPVEKDIGLTSAF